MSEPVEVSAGSDTERDDAFETESWLAEQMRLMVVEEGRGP